MDRSICSQLVALRRRNTEIIFHIGDLLRGDAGDMVRKGVGWLLKEDPGRRGWCCGLPPRR